MLTFEPGARYSRADIKERAGLGRDAKGGPWDTGIVEHNEEFLIFANVGVEGRTGHDYNNRWEGDVFHWYHKKKSRTDWPSVKRMLTHGAIVHLFYRTANRGPFEYVGLVRVLHVLPDSPVEVLWTVSEY